jgi:hypothetical protein
MRLRKLGRGQTVVFCVPEDIRTKILECRSFLQASELNLDHVFVGHAQSNRQVPLSVSDVLLWAISETYAEISRCIALWAVQGHRFTYQEMLWEQVKATGSLFPSQQVAKKFLGTYSCERQIQSRVSYSDRLFETWADFDDRRRGFVVREALRTTARRETSANQAGGAS